MKILFNNTIFFHQKYGGVSRYSVSLAKELIKKKIDIKILSPIFKNRYLREISNVNKYGFFLKRYPNIKLLEYLNNKIIQKELKKNTSKIIHDGYYSQNILKIKNKIKVLTIHDLIHEKFFNLYNKNPTEIRKKIISKTDFFICVSQKTKEDFIEYYKVPEKKIKVIYHGADHLNYYEKFESQKLSFDKPFILYVGSRAKYKNFDLLIKTYANSIKIKNNFDLVCFGGGKFLPKEIELLSRLNLLDKIKQVNGDDFILKKLFKKASVFVFTSYYEGFGLPLLEAMQIGCPVLASDIDVFREICGDSIEYFNHESIEDLDHKLENLLFSSSSKDILIRKGHEQVKKYNWANCADQVIDLYNNLN